MRAHFTPQAESLRGRELGMSAAELEQFADAFEHREREVAQSIIRENRG
jgi:hypothetical protein